MSNPLVPVTLLTGFLGSGKTTTLNRLLRTPAAARTAVVVNEFGEIGLDQVLIERASAGTVLLANGCVCCTVRDDLGGALQQLLLQRAQGEIPQFQRVVIETTGLADPAPILQLLMTDTLVTSSYRLGGVVATVDAVNGLPTFERHAEAVKQAAVADRLVLTKSDLATRAQVLALRNHLAALNPAAPIFNAAEGDLDSAGLFDAGLYNPRTGTLDVQRWLGAEAYAARDHDHAPCVPGCGEAHGRHDHGIRSYSIVLDEPVPWHAFSRWLEMLTLKRGESLLRVKAIVDIAEHPGKPVVLHGVQQIFHPPVALDSWPSDDHRTRLVFITRDIGKDAIEETLRLFAYPKGGPS